MSAQSQLYQIYSDKLFAVCLKYCRNYEDAEDTLQDSFITIFKKINQYKNKGSFEGWLKRITINTALQKYRDTAAIQVVDKILENKKTEEINFKYLTIDVNILLGFIQKLPDRYRMIFNLYVLDNYSHKEISKLLGISEGTSKSNLSRARKILKEQIKNYQATTE